MPVDVTSEIIIDRAVKDVAGYVTDPGNAPEWYVNIESVEPLTPPPLAVGSRMRFTARFLGRRLTYTYEIAALVPHVRLVMRTSEGPFPMETTYTWTSEGAAATRMTLRNRGEPAGFAAVTAPMLAAAMKRANRKDLERLKSIMDQR